MKYKFKQKKNKTQNLSSVVAAPLELCLLVLMFLLCLGFPILNLLHFVQVNQ